MSGYASASGACISLYYPAIEAPYRAIFDEITAGVEDSSDIEIKTITFEETQPKDNIQQPCDIAIGLGRAGVGYLDQYGQRLTRIYGAIQAQPNQLSEVPTISLVPYPLAMFERLKYFMPSAERVHVIYNPGKNQKYIELAVEQAKTFNIKLVTYQAMDIRGAGKFYQDVFANISPKKEALWLLQDPSITDSKVILPNILKMAWRKRLVVFSNQPSHAKRGVLFSVYADNYALGLALGEVAKSCAVSECIESKIQALSTLRTAINIRTSARLGISANSIQDKFIDLTFPSQ